MYTFFCKKIRLRQKNGSSLMKILTQAKNGEHYLALGFNSDFNNSSTY